MAMQARDAANAVQDDFPLREYIGAMACELAQMARSDGDEALGRLLDSAAYLADPETATRSTQRIAHRPDIGP